MIDEKYYFVLDPTGYATKDEAYEKNTDVVHCSKQSSDVVK